MVTYKEIEQILKSIPDPELGISIWDLGLIYSVSVKSSTVEITMTLTSIGCPLFEQIARDIQDKINTHPGVKKVTVELTFEPPWSPERMSQSARSELGFLTYEKN